MKNIAIIGGSGYIGKHLIQFLVPDYKVTSLQRNIHTIMPRQHDAEIVSISENEQTFDVIINTSYNLGKDIQQVYKQNQEVLRIIQKASHAQTHIIHLSSLAVFGFGLDKFIMPQPVPLQKDYGYVQSKVHMEHILLTAFPHDRLSIIRLGNVWGPGNNSWTQPVADALQWGLPVSVPSRSFSNITYINHITDYISYVIKHTERKTFHHLAEFSFISWQQIIAELSESLKVIPSPITEIPFYAASIGEEIDHALQQNPIGLLKQLRDGRFSSHYFPNALFAKLQFFFKKIKPAAPVLRQTPYHPDPTFYWILTCQREFKTEVLPGWNPPYTWQEVTKAICLWMEEAGYINE